MDHTVTVALVGIGGYGNYYVEHLLAGSAAHQARFVAAIDPQPRNCRFIDELQAEQIPIYPDLNTFYASSSADLVIIAAPIHLHEPLTIHALQHGSHVLCEKPAAATVQSARCMADAAAAAGRFLAIGYQWSFTDTIQKLKADILAGRLGQPRRMLTQVYWPRPQSYFQRATWAGRIKSDSGDWVLDSPVNNATAHYLHNLLYLLGDQRETAAAPAAIQAELYRANNIENYDTAALRIWTENGVEILFYTTHAVDEERGPICRCEFENAVVTYDINRGDHFVADIGGQVVDYGSPNDTLENKLWQSVDAVRTGAAVACDIHTAHPHVLCVNGAQAANITAISEQYISEIQLGVDYLRRVNDLKSDLMRCYEKGILPAEDGNIPWAVEGKRVNLRDLKAFPLDS